jgi:activating signal cointegrator 1
MKALTLIQPWASLIADGRKPVETRSRPLSHRGPLAIHAGNKVDREACKQFGYDPDSIPVGAVLCIVDMVDCVKFPSPHVTPDLYGDYTPGRYGYILELLERFAPVPARGYQCLWNWERLP